MRLVRLTGLTVCFWLGARIVVPADTAGLFDDEQVLPSAPTSSNTVQVVADIDRALADGRLNDAAKLVQRGLAGSPNDAQLLVRAAHIFTARRMFFVAEDYWAQLAELFPTNAWVNACWGGLLLRVDRREQAEKVLSKSLQLEPGQLVARYNIACLHLAGKRPIPADTLSGIGTMDTGRLCTWIRDDTDVLVELLTVSGYRKLCHLVLTGEAGGPSSETPADLRTTMDAVAQALWQTHIALTTNDWKGALAGLEKAEHQGAVARQILADIAYCRFNTGQPMQALDEIQRLSEKHPDYFLALSLKGQFLLELRENAKAEEALKAALAAKPKDAVTMMYLAAAVAAQDRMAEARRLAGEAMTLNPEAGKCLDNGKPFFKALEDDQDLIKLRNIAN